MPLSTLLGPALTDPGSSSANVRDRITYKRTEQNSSLSHYWRWRAASGASQAAGPPLGRLPMPGAPVRVPAAARRKGRPRPTACGEGATAAALVWGARRAEPRARDTDLTERDAGGPRGRLRGARRGSQLSPRSQTRGLLFQGGRARRPVARATHAPGTATPAAGSDARSPAERASGGGGAGRGATASAAAASQSGARGAPADADPEREPPTCSRRRPRPGRTMALLLRVVLLCGVAGEWEPAGPGRSPSSGRRCPRPPGNNGRGGGGGRPGPAWSCGPRGEAGGAAAVQPRCRGGAGARACRARPLGPAPSCSRDARALLALARSLLSLRGVSVQRSLIPKPGAVSFQVSSVVRASRRNYKRHYSVHTERFRASKRPRDL